ncbi:glycosyltransferase family 39 protein [Ktedonobacteria bacterium brp13]|nr:glycosyltransferase family 39 protein [Ktedonobacteria bacterium brp13]
MRQLKVYMPGISVFCVALFVRIVYNIVVANGYTPTFDAGIYNNLAHSLIHTQCYCRAPHQPTTFRPPLWPFMLAAIYSIAGEHSSYARLFYCVLDSGTCVLIYLLASDLFGKRIALITGLVAALYVGLFVWTGWLYTETLYTFCLTALIFTLSRLQQNILLVELSTGTKALTISRPVWKWLIASGLLLGLTLLTRPTGAILIGLLCIWALILIVRQILPWRATLIHVFLVLIIAMVVNVPWLYRNYLVTHTVFPISTIGTTLVGSYNDTVLQGDNANIIRGMWYPSSNIINPDFQRYTLADAQGDTARALAWMRTHLNEMPTLLGLHILNMWTPYLYAHGLPFEQFRDRLSSKVMPYLIPIVSIPIFLLAAVGFFVTWRCKRKQLILIYLVIVLTILQNIAFYGSPRYRAPIEPLLILFVGGMLWWLLGAEDTSGTRRYFRARKARVQEVIEHILPTAKSDEGGEKISSPAIHSAE